MPKRKTRTFTSSRSAKNRKRLRYTPGATRGIRGRRRRVTTRSNLTTMGFLKIERKFYDTFLTATAIASPEDAEGGELDPSATSMITTPTVGDGEQQRDGKHIACLYITLKGVINVPSTEDAANPVGPVSVFLAVVLDTQTNAAQMNSEDCFKNTSSVAIMAANPMKNLLFANRFRILKSRLYEFPFVQNSVEGDNLHSASGQQKNFDWFIPLRGMQINFNAGTTASIANVIDNSVHVIAYSSNSISLAPTLQYNARLRFVG